MKRYYSQTFVLLFLSASLYSCNGTDEVTEVDNTDFTYEFAEKYQLKSRRNLFNKDLIPMNSLTFPAAIDTQIVLESGSYIRIPENAFIDDMGDIYDGIVNLKYREFNDPVEFLASGLPMTIGANDKEIEAFQSAGMFEIEATSEEGKNLQPNPETPIELGIASNKKEDYPLWKFEEEEGWQEAEDPEILTEEDIDSAANMDIPPVPKPDKVNGFTYKITSKLVEEKNHLKPYEEWSFIPTDPNCESKMVHYCKNVEVERKGGGLYDIIITTWANTKAICECKRYQGQSGYTKKLEEYKEQYGEYIKYKSLMREVQYRFKENGNSVLRKINLTRTGTFNCDIVTRIPWEDYTYDYVQGYEKMDVALYCVDFTLGMKYACVMVNSIGIYHENDYAVIAVTKDKIMYSSKSECRKSYKNKHFTFDLTEMDKDTNILEIYAKLKE